MFLKPNYFTVLPGLGMMYLLDVTTTLWILVIRKPITIPVTKMWERNLLSRVWSYIEQKQAVFIFTFSLLYIGFYKSSLGSSDITNLFLPFLILGCSIQYSSHELYTASEHFICGYCDWKTYFCITELNFKYTYGHLISLTICRIMFVGYFSELFCELYRQISVFLMKIE